MYRASFVTLAVFALSSLSPLRAIDPGRDFSGTWVLDTRATNLGSLPFDPVPRFDVVQQDAAIRCSSGTAQWSYLLNGAESRYRLGKDTHNSVVKWEGAALLINTLVSGSDNYTLMDRWKLSANYDRLTVTRQIIRGTAQTEGVLVYRKDLPVAQSSAVLPPERPPAFRPEAPVSAPDKAPVPPPARAAIAPPVPETPPPPVATTPVLVRAGTRIPLVFLNTIDTKHSHEGDRIYLQTAFPIALDGRIVIPRGSAVTGVVTQAKRPGRVSGKGELYIRFDSLTLPNGVTRDFRSRLGTADASAAGKVDGQEGKISGEGNKAGDARRVGETAGTGASVGVMTGAAAGHAGMGAGVGGAAGAAAGLATVLFTRGPDAMLPKGTTVEMILDRDLQFRSDELRF
jgi:type IV secretion system protein VirB10